MIESSAPVLITGATGFIGQRLHRHLLDRGRAVRALVRPASRDRGNLDPRCEISIGELTDVEAWGRALEGVRQVVYGAGAVRGRTFDDFRAANVSGIAALVETLRLSPGAERQVVLVSSLAASRPTLSDYARSKRRGEDVLRRAEDIGWTVLRPPAVYGPGDREMWGLLVLARRGLALRPGPAGQRLALLHVDDLVRAVEASLAHPAACRHGCYELDDGKPGGYDAGELGAAVAGRPVREAGVPSWLLRAVANVNRAFAGLIGYAPMLTPGKVRELQQSVWLCDNSPFTQATGWRPEIDLAKGAAALFR